MDRSLTHEHNVIGLEHILLALNAIASRPVQEKHDFVEIMEVERRVLCQRRVQMKQPKLLQKIAAFLHL